LNLSSIAEVQLVCILQEALANVRKHAHAHRVNVVISRLIKNSREFIKLQVIDDGVGIVDQISKHSFGIKTMQERANTVGGSMEMNSFPGKGTKVTCLLPCLAVERVKENRSLFSKEDKIAIQ
jgi:signal transduction histidine kinase